jgi:hypothetical protein
LFSLTEPLDYALHGRQTIMGRPNTIPRVLKRKVSIANVPAIKATRPNPLYEMVALWNADISQPSEILEIYLLYV